MEKIKKLIMRCISDIIKTLKYKHLFGYPELEKTSTGLDNAVPIKYYSNCDNTLKTVIKPIRERFPDIKISSWYRSPEVNEKVGGAPKSSHMTGEAIDFNSPTVPIATLFRWVKKNIELDYIKVYASHIHITKRNKK